MVRSEQELKCRIPEASGTILVNPETLQNSQNTAILKYRTELSQTSARNLKVLFAVPRWVVVGNITWPRLFSVMNSEVGVPGVCQHKFIGEFWFFRFSA